MGEYDSSLKKVDLTLSDGIDICDVVTVSYRFDSAWINKVELMLTNYYDTEEFNELYSYDGSDFGDESYTQTDEFSVVIEDGNVWKAGRFVLPY